ncbi:TPA: hypothetical protein HA246_02920 [Candidatus Woesearchaeota archaeon]|nr:hypothetical protein [Candidatus Woesearchaeota archaeon]
MVIHLLQEEHIRIKCMYCKEDLSKREDWRSEFAGDEHYKSVTCNCGKESWIRVGFSGSGHDFWDGSASWILPNNTSNAQENNKNNGEKKEEVDKRDEKNKDNIKKTLEESI